ncbi:hypothetical protein MN086_10660 [Sulfurovum sp. XGS-02]|uniref:hypothetical protein n=1 Tax=Sulfurovum sp. XGS-02 TaxID=2925411 RepID=UPI00204D1A45|nr:hypothetical protein [Sulfurovum sp. XGS-02]UPT77495.1 hypothetical protein MN086_10660 [Sulfurovum sp. XGS-02]
MAGYLAYSDRPGPGWYAEPFSLSWEEFLSNTVYILGWALLLSIYAIIIALVLFGLVRLLERFKMPDLGVAIVGAVLSGLLSAYIVLGIGWYIAIGLPAIIVGLVLGMLFGAFLLPQKRSIAA